VQSPRALLDGTAARGVFHINGCSEVVTNGWYQVRFTI